MNKPQDIKQYFSNIYDKYFDSIYKFIFLKTPSKETAQDITSDVFLKFFNYIVKNGYKSINNPRAFLYKTARNLISDYYRKNSHIPFSQLPDDLPDLEQGIEQKIDIDIQINFVKKQLQQLPQEYQDIIIMYYLEEIPIKEIAEIVDKTENNVRVIIHRCLQHLKQSLQ
ncbi:RNA polymerase sigma factor YlaC [bacterium HR34]|nr:RNA polymerase sigma factor YlaC [bacterium HR34]